jgi:uncharacterized protein YggE
MVSLCIFIFYFFSLIFTQSTGQYCDDNTVKASGQGTVSGLPDKAIIQLSFIEKGATTSDAVLGLSSKINQAVAILNKNGYNSYSS